jgi:hypothetical protein
MSVCTPFWRFPAEFRDVEGKIQLWWTGAPMKPSVTGMNTNSLHKGAVDTARKPVLNCKRALKSAGKKNPANRLPAAGGNTPEHGTIISQW